MGTGHLNDFVLTTPCFHHGKLVALLSCTSIGGIGFGRTAPRLHGGALHPHAEAGLARGDERDAAGMIRANTRAVGTEGDVIRWPPATMSAAALSR
jgi:N-methylhydantoinase B